MAKIGEWYHYENGDLKHTFKIVDIDGEYLMFNNRQGYCDVLCRPATLWEIMLVRHIECQPKSYRLAHAHDNDQAR